MNILSELLFEKGDWFNYLRMDHETFLELLSIIKPFIEKQDLYEKIHISPEKVDSYTEIRRNWTKLLAFKVH